MITVFGASVTQQRTGYATQLENKLGDTVTVFGYGGMHLNDAAMCFMDNAIAEKPEICFIDWFSTGYNEISTSTEEYIDTIIHKFSQIQCKLVFLFLAYDDNPAKAKFYTFCKKVLREREMAFIDLHDEIERKGYQNILRDNIHTTEYGSTLYSEIIAKKFKDIRPTLSIPTDTIETKYTAIKKLKVEKEFAHRIDLKGQCEVIGFNLTVGRHSGLVEIKTAETTQIVNTWTRWCHYPRKAFYLSFNINESATVQVSDEAFDTSSCKHPVDFTRVKKKLVVHEIYWVGSSLSIENMQAGKRISKLAILYKRVAGRLGQYKIDWMSKLGFT